MARRKTHPLTLALQALGRKPEEVEHFICEGDKVEVFFKAPPAPVAAPVTAATNGGSPFARPAVIPPGYGGENDKAADEGEVEAMDLIRRKAA